MSNNMVVVKLKRLVAYASISCLLCAAFSIPLFTYVAISGVGNNRGKLVNRFKRPIINENEKIFEDRDGWVGESTSNDVSKWTMQGESLQKRDTNALYSNQNTRLFQLDPELQFDVQRVQHIHIRENTVSASDLVFTVNHPEKCMRGGGMMEIVDLLILVTSRVSNAEQRDLIRKTWGNTNFYDGRNVVVLFLVGNPKYTQHEYFHRILLEDIKYNDIVAGNFEDSYSQLTLKTILGLKWAKKYCSLARYVMKCDDDVLLQPHNLLRYVYRGNIPTAGAFVGACANASRSAPLKDTGFRPKDGYWPYAIYPAYCSGTAYLMSGDLVPKLFECALETRVYRYEDVFMGILAYKLGIPVLRHTAFRPSIAPEDACRIRDLVVSHHLSSMGYATNRITPENYRNLVSKLWWRIQLLRKGYSTCTPYVSGLGDKLNKAIYTEEIEVIHNNENFSLYM